MMRRFWLFLCAVAAAVSCRADLNSDINAVLAEKLLGRVKTGIEIIKLGDKAETSAVIYSHNPTDQFIPASNLKVITTSATLDALGPDFRFRTVLVQHGNDLVLIGDGDPTFGDAEFLRKLGWDVTTVYRNWAEAMKKKGIRRVADVVIDDSVFDESFFQPHWPAGQSVLRYSAEVGGLNLNANCVDFFFQFNGVGESTAYHTVPDTEYLTVQNRVVGGNSNSIDPHRPITTNTVTFGGVCPQSSGVPVSVTVHDPPMYAGTVLAETLKANGITITGQVRRDRTIRAALRKTTPTPATAPATTTASTQPAQEWTLLAIHETPLLQVMARANKDSVNLYAESMCKRLGFEASGESGSWENGTAAVGAFLQKAGVSPDEFHLDDGCGLSHQNTISANAMVHVLTYDFFSKNRQASMGTLSVAGSDGTLERRFPAPYADMRGRVFGKSGFVEGVSSLSGFLHTKNDQWYVFSILMNGIPPKSNSAYKPLQEAVVRAVDNYAEKSAK